MSKHALSFIALLGLVAAGPAPLAGARAAGRGMPVAATGFDRYWPAFRAAALARDMRALAALSAFPLRSKGELDDDPVRPVTPARLPTELGNALAAPVGDGTTGSLLDRIRATPRLAPRDIDGGDHQRFGSLGFARVRGRWALTTIYRGAD